MKPTFLLATLIFLMSSLACNDTITVDSIFFNGKIFTARSNSDFVEAMAIKNGKIVATGNKSELFRKYTSKDSIGVNLNGRVVVPGFHDSHLHFWSGARLHHQLDLRGLASLEQVLDKIQRAVDDAREGEWIIGRGWDHELWQTKVLPDRRLLDEISRTHPIYLKRVDGHAAWVNSEVLELLRYTRYTPDPPGGEIMRYPHNNRPNGILFDAAFDLLDKIIPEPTFTQKYEQIDEAIDFANQLGITSITDNSSLKLYEVYAQLLNDEKLDVRVNFWIDYRDNLDSLKNYVSTIGAYPQRLTASLIKLYADGSLGSRTAFLKAPYNDAPDKTGLPQHSFSELHDMVKKADEAGFQVGIHGIGDAGIERILNAYDAVQMENPQQHRRWRIEHAQVMDSADFNRFRELNVIASMQPSHCSTDLRWADARIGDRARFSYAWKSFLQHDVALSFGTDWPVEPLNPMVGIYAAITRQDSSGYPEGGWYPQERISIGEAIRAYTYGSAFAAKNENWCGTLQAGRAADFIILDRDIFEASPREVLHTKVLATYLGGRQVYSRE